MKVTQIGTGKVLWEGETLYGADLSRADLYGADLSGADLSGADLYGANLKDAKSADLAIAKTRILAEGELIGWKKLKDSKIARLIIPAGAKRSHAFGRKCRAEYAKVAEIFGPKGDAHTEGVSDYVSSFVYRVGETVKCDRWESDWQVECGGGIHFFITREEAEAYSV